MTWLLILLTSISVVISLGAAVIAARTANAARLFSAECAKCCGELSEKVSRMHSTASTHVELAEMRDAIGKAEELLKKVNQREVMRARRSGNGIDAAATKDELRRAAGLVAGKPAPHQ